MNRDTSQLSKREKEVTELLLQGKSNKQIALALGISASTVEYHLKNIYKKLQVNSRTEAVLRLGKSIGSNVTSELGKSTVEMNGETADNGVLPISSTRRIPMNKMFAMIGGGLLTITLIAVLVLVNMPAQSAEIVPTAQSSLPTVYTPLPTLTPTDFPTSTPATTEISIPTFKYIVESGDTCAFIAANFYASVEDIIDINNLSPLCVLESGQMLLIPYSTQEILLYFSRANSDTLPLQPFQLTPIPEVTTPEPNSVSNANLTVNEVEKGVGFDILEPTLLLSDTLSFQGANYDSDNKIAYLFYLLKDSDPTNGVVLREQKNKLTDECDLCGVVGASALIEKFQIGNDTGEYVEGVWSLTEKGPVWEPTPYLKTLRWQSNGMAFELLSFCPPDSISKSDMIKLAESLK